MPSQHLACLYACPCATGRRQLLHPLGCKTTFVEEISQRTFLKMCLSIGVYLKGRARDTEKEVLHPWVPSPTVPRAEARVLELHAGLPNTGPSPASSQDALEVSWITREAGRTPVSIPGWDRGGMTHWATRPSLTGICK